RVLHLVVAGSDDAEVVRPRARRGRGRDGLRVDRLCRRHAVFIQAWTPASPSRSGTAGDQPRSCRAFSMRHTRCDPAVQSAGAWTGCSDDPATSSISCVSWLTLIAVPRPMLMT